LEEVRGLATFIGGETHAELLEQLKNGTNAPQS
jgi:hypothetical protein